MNLSISRETLLPALEKISGVVPSNNPMLPILSDILVDISESELRLTASDSEVELSVGVSGTFDQSGAVTLPARKLLDLSRVLPQDAILDFAFGDGRATITSGRSRFVLLTSDAGGFPRVDPGEATYRFTLPQHLLRTLLERTHFAMASQDVRYYLNGLFLETLQGALRAVATDGHRLALCDVDADLPEGGENRIIIPRKGVTELLRLVTDSETEMDMSISENHVRVSLGELVFTSKLIDGTFPEYGRVLPEPSETPVLAQREVLSQGLKRASILSSDKYRLVKISLGNDKLRAHVHNAEQEQAEDEIDVQYAGADLSMGFNVSYLLDAINNIESETVKLSIANPKSGCLVLPGEGSKCTYVVMPMLL